MDANWYQQLPIETIQSVTSVGGGDVNEAFHVITTKRELFLLVQRQQAADFYAGEIAGLQAFAAADILAPQVVANGQIQGDAYLVLSYLTPGRGRQTDLGKLVAQLHKTPSPNGQFGFDLPYSGSTISFDNPWTDDWATIFLEVRLDKLAQRITAAKLWPTQDIDHYQEVRQVITAKLAQHQSEPVLLHGDLWSGNYLFLADGRPALIDPAAWYGDREFDIGITTVFGGFDEHFYAAYERELPLAAGADERIHFYRLYYLMVHLLKFGTSYYSSVQREFNAILSMA